MKVLEFRDEIWLPQPPESLFPFFTNVRHLERITPPWLHFEILTPFPIALQEGTRIRFRLKLYGVPVQWESRIAVWRPPFEFADVQVRGPYRLWYHRHLFELHERGTRMRDEVRYAVPGGQLVDRLFVRRRIQEIFRFRRMTLQQLFEAGASNARVR